MNEKKLKINCLKFILDNNLIRSGSSEFDLADELYLWAQLESDAPKQQNDSEQLMPDMNWYGASEINLEEPNIKCVLKSINRPSDRMKQLAGIDKLEPDGLDEDESDFEVDIKSVKNK